MENDNIEGPGDNLWTSRSAFNIVLRTRHRLFAQDIAFQYRKVSYAYIDIPKANHLLSI